MVNSGTSNGNNNDRDYYVPPRTTKANNQGRDRNTNNQKPHETSTNSFGFIADSLAGSGLNSNNHNSITQRPFRQQTSTTVNYNFDNRETASSTTYRPSRDISTKKSTYFQGDLTFVIGDETSVRLKGNSLIFENNI